METGPALSGLTVPTGVFSEGCPGLPRPPWVEVQCDSRIVCVCVFV